MAKDHLSALPTGKQHDPDRDEGKNEPERHNRRRAMAVALIEAEQLNQHQDHIADSVLPVCGRVRLGSVRKGSPLNPWVRAIGEEPGAVPIIEFAQTVAPGVAYIPGADTCDLSVRQRRRQDCNQ
jgi:hypothetical protein